MWIKRPRTQSVITVSLVLVLLVFFVVAFVAFYLNNQKKKVFIESSQRQIANSVQIAFSLESNRLKQVAFDYTYWDEMVHFVARPDSGWASNNLATIISTFNTDLVGVLDTLTREVYTVVNPIYPFLRSISLSDSTLSSLLANRFVDTYLLTPAGVLELHGATVHPNSDPDRSGRPQGIFLLGKIIDTAYLDKISNITNTSLTLNTQSSESVHSASGNSVEVNIPLRGEKGEVIAYINVFKVYDFFKQYSRFSLILMSILYISSIATLILLVVIITYWVNKPLMIVEHSLLTDDATCANDLKKYGSEFVKIGELMRDFIAQKKTLAELKDKAEEADRLKSAFLANMSHEIRTPLNAILGFSELICKKSPDDAETNSYKRIVRNSSNDLLHLINDILDYSKIEAGQLSLANELFSLNELVADVATLYRKKADKLLTQGVELRFENNSSNVILNTDRHRLKQILINLIDNATKFTERGYVEVGFMVQKDRCKLYVKDTGIGIPEEAWEMVFERFRQAARNPTRLYGGTGLGLSICKGLTQLMGGNIWVEPNNPEGSVFFVSLPITSLELPNDKSEKEQSFIYPDWNGKRIVLIEDDELTVSLIKEYLAKTRAELVSFKVAEPGVEYLRVAKADCVLMDIRMPGEIDGLAATRMIREFNPSIPIVAETAFAMDSDREKALGCGCNDYIAKPFSAMKLIKLVSRYISDHPE